MWGGNRLDVRQVALLPSADWLHDRWRRPRTQSETWGVRTSHLPSAQHSWASAPARSNFLLGILAHGATTRQPATQNHQMEPGCTTRPPTFSTTGLDPPPLPCPLAPAHEMEKASVAATHAQPMPTTVWILHPVALTVVIRSARSPTGGYYTYDSSQAGYVPVTWSGANSDFNHIEQPAERDQAGGQAVTNSSAPTVPSAAVLAAPVLTATAAKAQMQGRRQKQEGAWHQWLGR
eukprot:SAG31_NODE_285_length_18479_cov_9.871980_20_plen_234_part_00